MRSYWKGSLTVGALAIALLVVVQMAAAQAPRASDKARGYYGPAASPDPADGFNLTPGSTGQRTVTATRRFSYAPAPVSRPAQPVAPQTQRAAPAQPVPAPAATTSVQPRRYSYQPAPLGFWGRDLRTDRVLGRNPADRKAAAKANGEY
jgi:hypothetical protein